MQKLQHAQEEMKTNATELQNVNETYAIHIHRLNECVKIEHSEYEKCKLAFEEASKENNKSQVASLKMKMDIAQCKYGESSERMAQLEEMVDSNEVDIHRSSAVEHTLRTIHDFIRDGTPETVYLMKAELEKLNCVGDSWE